MRCVIKKFGGACFADNDCLCRVARKIADQEQPTVVVVSARKGVTDHLSRTLKALSESLATPAADLLLATGELQSAALLAAALTRIGRPAQVIPPWLVFRTDAICGDATIQHVNARPVADSLRRGVIPIVPGFIGATADGQITTLGRGGSDYSAVALGIAQKAERVELYKAEVDGVYNADPHAHGDAQRFDVLTHAEALRLARAGGKVLQEKAAELACRWSMPVWVLPAFASGRGTAIGGREGLSRKTAVAHRTRLSRCEYV